MYLNMFYYEVYLVKILIQPYLLDAGNAYFDLLIASHFVHAMDQFSILRNVVDTPSSFNLSLRSVKA